jgi:hypothetical protein
MTLGGKLLLDDSVSLDIEGTSSKEKMKVTWATHKVSPAKIATGPIKGGLDGADEDKNKLELLAGTGFGD